MVSETRFLEILSREFSLAGITLTPTTGLYDELGLDSFDAFRLLLLIEELADSLIPPAVVPELYSVGDAYGYYCALVGLAETVAE